MKSGEEITTVDSDCKTSVIQYDYINTIDVTSQINSDSVNNVNLCSNNEIECSSRMNDILTEFTKLYTEKLRRIDDVSGEEELKQKVSLLECWVKDLGEQNSVLVSTVEDLEKEANRRVFLLQEKLDNMAIVTRKSCVSLRDHQVQVTSLIKKKLTVEDEAKVLQEKILNLETVKNSLLQENSFLRQDLDNVLEVVSRGRVTGRWECNEITFNSIRPDQIIGSEQEKALRNYSLQILENSENEKTHNDSLTSIQSIEDDVISVPKLKQEIQNLKKVHRDTNAILIQRDKHIADLQAQLTELHHKLSAAQAQVDNTTSTLHCLIDRGRHDSLQIIRRDDVIRQLLSPTRRFKNENLKAIDEDDTKMKTDIECQLNHNIDLLANRLIELEEECQQLKHQNALLNKSQAIEASSVEKMNDFQNNVSTLHDRRFINSAYISVDVTNKQTQTEEKNSTYNNSKLENISSHNMLKVSKLENELSEKNILIRELQNHLVLSREELRLKDETLYNIEQKLESKRRNYDEKEERMLYLTSQLTNLQLEVSRLHGNLQQTRLELDSKSELVLKLEYENRSLVRQLNEKSSVYEGIQNDISHLLLDIENKKKEIADQKRTIGSLQDALVASKINCDKLRSQYVTESDYNVAFNMSMPPVLHPAQRDTLSLQSETSKDNASRLFTTVPVNRSVNTDSSLHRNCPDVVSFPNMNKLQTLECFHDKIQNGINSLESHSSIKSLSFNSNLPHPSSPSFSLQTNPIGAKSLTFSSSDSINSFHFSSDKEYKSLMAQSPTDSGIGAEDFVNNAKENYSEANAANIGSFGKIFEI